MYSTSTDHDTQAEFLRQMYGGATGWACVAHQDDAKTGRFHEEWFQYPQQADEMIEYSLAWADTHHVWFCVNLMPTPHRSKSSSVARHWLHVDVDDDLVLESGDHFTRLEELEPMIVNSGSGHHQHLYVKLAEPVDTDTYHRLERGLVAYFHGDPGKINDNDLLRMPGTFNHKNGQKREVIWEDEDMVDEVKAHDPNVLLGFLPHIPESVAVEAGSDPITPIETIIPQSVASVLDARTPDRSSKTPKIINACKAVGLSLEQTLWILLQDQGQAERYSEKGVRFMHREVRSLYATSTAVNSDAETAALEALAGDDVIVVPTKPKRNPGVRLRHPSEMARAEKLEWIAPGLIPEVGITALVGDEGIGKSSWWVWITAIITNGWACPELGMEAREPRIVVVIANEDDWATTVLPRLQAADVNLDYIRFFGSEDGTDSPLFPDEDAMQDIRDLDAENKIAMVVVDTWINSVKPGVDMKSPLSARTQINPWKELSQDCRLSVMLVTHTNRTSSSSIRDKVGISGELRRVVRSMIMAQMDTTTGLFTIGVDKSNFAKPGKAYEYDIIDAVTQDGIKTGKMIYRKRSEFTAAEISENDYATVNSSESDAKDCAAWLLETMMARGGSVDSKTLRSFNKATENWTESQLRTARKKLGVKIGAKLEDNSNIWSL